jgi:hypothetical protein
VQELEKRFNERNGTIICDELINIDMRNADRELIKKITKEKCHSFVRDAAEILEDMLLENE